MDANSSQDPDNIDPAQENRQVVSAIKEYCRFGHAQGFAVMVNGKWGCGKTYLVKSIIREIAGQETKRLESKPLYISLYGVKNVDEISDLIYQQLHPIWSSKPVRLGSVILKAVARGTLKMEFDAGQKDSFTINPSFPDIGSVDLMKGASHRLFVFDDFERTLMPATELLGYINPFVEHDNCKVLIVANEAEIKDDKDYKLRKEKTVGRTYQIRPDAEAAFDDFTCMIDDIGAREFLIQEKNSLLRVFEDSKSGNLRILKHSLWDFERLWQILKSSQKKNRQAMHELLVSMCAISFEVRIGRIATDALRGQNLPQWVREKGQKDDTSQTNEDMSKRYPSVDWSSTVLSPATIQAIVEQGKIVESDIQRQLSQNPHFVQPKDIPSWIVLWKSYELSEQEQEDALTRFESDFEARKFRLYEEILHVIGLCLWLSEIGQSNWSQCTIVRRLEEYIEDVYSGNDANIDDVKPQESLSELMGGAYGLGFKMNDDARFKRLASQLRSRNQDWRNRALPRVADRLKHLMTTDGEAFLREVCHTSGGAPRFANLAVLKAIKPDEFAEIFISTTYQNQRSIMLGLHIRYEQAFPGQELNVEIPWANEVHNILIKMCQSKSPMKRDQLSNLVNHYLGASLSKVTNAGS